MHMIAVQELSFQDFAKQIKATQDAYAAAKQSNGTDAMKQALFQVRPSALAVTAWPWGTLGCGSPRTTSHVGELFPRAHKPALLALCGGMC